MIPFWLIKAALSFGFSIFLYLLGSVYSSYTRNPSIKLPEDKINEAFANNPLTRQASEQKSTNKPVVIITGSTAGIGYNVAAECYRLGLLVIIASRSKQKCEQAMKDIQVLYPNAKGALDSHVLDIGDFDSVINFVSWFKSRYSSLTFLINNAGIHYSQGEEPKLMKKDNSILSKQGYDEVFATNYMGHFLLTHLLLPSIKKGRVIAISSGLHYGPEGATLKPLPGVNSKGWPDAADGEKKGFMHRMNAYGVSKLAQCLHVHFLTKQFMKQHKEKDLQMISVCPGWVKTNMIPTGPLGKIIYQFAFPVRAATLTPLMGMVDPTIQGGEFVSNYIMPLTQGKFGRLIVSLMTKLGLRDLFSAVLGLSLAVLESNSYGYNRTIPSEESLDEKLAEDLYDWTLQEFMKKGYIKSS